MEKVKVSMATSECWEHLTWSINRAAKHHAFGGKTKTVKGNFVVAMDQRTIDMCEELSADTVAILIEKFSTKEDTRIVDLIKIGTKIVQRKLNKYWIEKKKWNFVRLPLDTERDCLISEEIAKDQTERVFSVIADIAADEDIESEVAEIIVMLALGNKDGGLEEEARSTRYWKLNRARDIFYSRYYAELIEEDELNLIKLAEAKAKRVDEEVALSDFISQLYRYARVIETAETKVVEYTPTEDDYRNSLRTLSCSALDDIIEQRPELIKFLD